MQPSKMVRDEIRLAILFYESRGWDWIDVVDFLIFRWRRGES